MEPSTNLNKPFVQYERTTQQEMKPPAALNKAKKDDANKLLNRIDSIIRMLIEFHETELQTGLSQVMAFSSIKKRSEKKIGDVKELELEDKHIAKGIYSFAYGNLLIPFHRSNLEFFKSLRTSLKLDATLIERINKTRANIVTSSCMKIAIDGTDKKTIRPVFFPMEKHEEMVLKRQIVLLETYQTQPDDSRLHELWLQHCDNPKETLLYVFGEGDNAKAYYVDKQIALFQLTLPDGQIQQAIGIVNTFQDGIFAYKTIHKGQAVIDKLTLLHKWELEKFDKLSSLLKRLQIVQEQLPADIREKPFKTIEPQHIETTHSVTKTQRRKGKARHGTQKPHQKEHAPVETLTPQPVKIPVREVVRLKDHKIYQTYQILIKAEPNTTNITWNDVVKCLSTIGFTIKNEGVAYTFKIEHHRLLVMDLDITEIVEGKKSKTLHMPHDKGLNETTPLDEGRLSSFTLLLQKAGFKQDTVKLE